MGIMLRPPDSRVRLTHFMAPWGSQHGLIADGRIFLHGDRCPPPPGYQGERFHYWDDRCRKPRTSDHFLCGRLVDSEDVSHFLMTLQLFHELLEDERPYRPETVVNILCRDEVVA